MNLAARERPNEVHRDRRQDDGGQGGDRTPDFLEQMPTQVLDERLEETFRDWYPDFRTKPPENEYQQAA